MHFEFSEEQQMIRQAARDFAQTELKPGVIERDEHQNDADVGRQSLPEVASEEQDVYPNHDSGHRDRVEEGADQQQ